MRRLTPGLVMVVIALCGVVPTAAAPCRVGIDVRTIYDASRPYGDQARPIRVVLWYPAASAAARPVTLSELAAADWLSPVTAAVGWSDVDAARRGLASRLAEIAGVEAAGAAAAAETRGCAGWSGAPRAGRFPLVLIGSGLSARAYFHSALAEALADAGFVVAFVSGLGPAPDVAPRFDVETVRMLAADAGRAIDALADDPRVDRQRIGLVGWSVGSVVQLAVARERPTIRAGVSLDGGIAYDYGPRLWAGLATPPPRAMPYLHLAAGVRNPVPLDDSLVKQLGARVQVVDGLSHPQFTDLPPTASPDTERSRALVRESVVAFLRAHLVHPDH